MTLKKGDFVVRVFSLPRSRCAVIKRVAKVTKAAVYLVGDSSLQYDPSTGNEIDPPIPMVSSYLVPFDADEVEKWELDSSSKAKVSP